MKKILFVVLSILSLTIFSKPPQFTIKKGKIKVNKTIVSDNYNITLFTKNIEGTPREREGYNKTYTYDDLGIVLFEPQDKEKKPSGTVSEFQIHFSVPEPNNVTPKNVYSGYVKVDKLKINGELTAEKLKKTLKKWEQTESYIEHSYRMLYGNIYIYFQFDSTETKLLKISIGKSTRAK